MKCFWSIISWAAVAISISASNTAFADTPPPASTDDEYLDNVQLAAFNYFWDYGHPASGLARESYGFHDPNLCASGATGMGLISIVVGSSRTFVTRSEAAARILTIVTFLEQSADRFHGAWPHWFACDTGDTIPFSPTDDGADLVETAFVVQGLMIVRKYFDSSTDPVEIEIRQRSTRLWEEVEWNFFVSGDCIYWHWSQIHGLSNLALQGYTETQIVYVLGAASPTFAIDPSLYNTCWTSSSSYTNTGSYYGIRQWVGPAFGGPLFWQHYSFLGLDPTDLSDGFTNYFRNSQAVGLIHQQHGIHNPYNHTGYSANSWGFTASFGPDGYGAWSPTNDEGVITPTASLSTMPFTPAESMLALKHFYNDFGSNLWGDYGFVNGFHEGRIWYAPGYLGIDQGTIAPMIENYRSGLCWTLFMNNTEIQPALDAMGFIKDPLANLLVNPGFEDGGTGTLSSVHIPGWEKFGTDGWLHPDAGETLGVRALKLWDGGNSGLSQTLAVVEAESYTFACYMASFSREGTLVNRAAVVTAEWYGISSLIKTDTVGNLTPSDDQDKWHFVDASFVAPVGAMYAKIVAKNVGLGPSPSGVTQFDGFSAVLVPVPPTSSPTTKAPSKKPSTSPSSSPSSSPSKSQIASPSTSPSSSPSTAPSKQPTLPPTKMPSNSNELTGTCSDGTGSCSDTDMSGCTCVNRRNLRRKQESSKTRHRELGPPQCNDGTCRKKCSDCESHDPECDGRCGVVTASSSPTSSPSLQCSCLFLTTTPTSSPTGTNHCACDKYTDRSICKNGCGGSNGSVCNWSGNPKTCNPS